MTTVPSAKPEPAKPYSAAEVLAHDAKMRFEAARTYRSRAAMHRAEADECDAKADLEEKIGKNYEINSMILQSKGEPLE